MPALGGKLPFDSTWRRTPGHSRHALVLDDNMNAVGLYAQIIGEPTLRCLHKSRKIGCAKLEFDFHSHFLEQGNDFRTGLAPTGLPIPNRLAGHFKHIRKALNGEPFMMSERGYPIAKALRIRPFFSGWYSL